MYTLTVYTEKHSDPVLEAVNVCNMWQNEEASGGTQCVCVRGGVGGA